MLAMTVSGALRKRKKPAANLWSTNTAYAKLTFRATKARDWFFHILHVNSFRQDCKKSVKLSRQISYNQRRI
jgi:hypothetical protein